jgi:hypothetical protein
MRKAINTAGAADDVVDLGFSYVGQKLRAPGTSDHELDYQAVGGPGGRLPQSRLRRCRGSCQSDPRTKIVRNASVRARGLVTKKTEGHRRSVPIIEPLSATLARLTAERATGCSSAVLVEDCVTATLRDATGRDELVDDLGLAGLLRHGDVGLEVERTL